LPRPRSQKLYYKKTFLHSLGRGRLCQGGSWGYGGICIWCYHSLQASSVKGLIFNKSGQESISTRVVEIEMISSSIGVLQPNLMLFPYQIKEHAPQEESLVRDVSTSFCLVRQISMKTHFSTTDAAIQCLSESGFRCHKVWVRCLSNSLLTAKGL